MRVRVFLMLSHFLYGITTGILALAIKKKMSSTIECYNADEIDIPKWLNDDFLITVLHSSEKDETIELRNFTLSPASALGDHYASLMYRAHVEYENKLDDKLHSMSMIIKIMPEIDGDKKETLGEAPIFETEIGMYTEVIPKFESILRAAGDNTRLGARCLYHSLSPKKVIVFEDLVTLGYNVIRNRDVNIEEVKAAYLKLAKWHAVSYKILQENPNYFEQYRHGFMVNPSMNTSDWMISGVGNFIKMLETQPKLLKYKPYFEAMALNLVAKSVATCKEYREHPQAGALYTLMHGDFHYKNMMFKHDPQIGETQDVMLLDFQMTFVGPMIIDVIYGVIMLMNREMRRNHKDELLYYFFSNFVNTLDRIDYSGRIPKMSEFRQMLMQHRHWEIFLLVTILPMWYGFRNSDPSEILHNAESRAKTFFDQNYVEEMEECLPKYLYTGYLDV